MLTGDFFELLEKLLKGVVYFLYNIVSTAGAIFRHPILGGYRLQRVHENPQYRQLGGLTFLFICFVAFYVLVLPGINVTDAKPVVMESAGRLGEALAEGPDLDLAGLWPSVAAALASILIVDASLRLGLWLRLRGRRHRRRRERIGGAVEFALFVPLLTYAAAYWLTAVFSRELMFEDWAGVVLLVLLGPTLVMPCLPPSIALSPAFRTRRPPRRPRLLAAALTGAVSVLLLGSIYVGYAVGSRIVETREMKAYVPEGLAATTLDCVLSPAGDLRVVAMLEVKNSGPRALAAGELFLSVKGTEAGGGKEVFAFPEDMVWDGEPANAHIIVTPASPRLVTVLAKVRPGSWQTCRIQGRNFPRDGDDVAIRFADGAPPAASAAAEAAAE